MTAIARVLYITVSGSWMRWLATIFAVAAWFITSASDPAKAQSSSFNTCFAQAVQVAVAGGGNGSFSCGGINFACTFNPGTGTETCNVSGACTGTATSTGSSNVTCGRQVATATLGQVAVQASRISLGAVQTQNQAIRDQIQRRMASPAPVRPLRFAPEQEAATTDDSPWQALAYRDPKSLPVYKAAPAATPVAPAVQYATWGQLFGDYEKRTGIVDGTDIGRKTTTGGGVGGAYATYSNVFYGGDALVLGVFGNGLSSHVSNNDGTTAKVDGGGVGVNAIYVRGAFSADTTFKADFLTIHSSAPGVPALGLTNLVVAPNLNYKFDFMPWWIEPTIGAAYTDTSWNSTATAFGFTHGHQWRVQGGARFGTSWDWNGVRVDPVLGIFAYSDVEVVGGTLASAVGTTMVPTDQGKVFGQGTGKLAFNWGGGWSSYVEGEVRGRSGVFGAAGRLGFTYAFQ